ncbi:MAG: SDR family oxidoreductase [Pseudomonadales bacterium]|jgi:NAD(P)-dependent dehydrogenase (short-subunit alcohol dehydrogenase family)|nr:SDR family oxidoreductase [Pseudomonadales bacterium]MDP6470940.1 SDR family oxidoreductase [Pseudomonadales bacterium]MDP6825875.1 SDR family oxidoreductase [Pseudomonadales bacterium]MDP6972843.1 SDR family oxidoreductase [Pseudomonadales bacterium]|tara:strand:- start:675 stop:1541 length:867 start_codon:yes stop_codon:yes gene_type:complete
MSYSFDDKVAIITGAGGGLGRCHALELASRGCKVVVNDLGGAMDGTGGSSDAANAVVEEIKASGGEAIANGGSVSDPAGAQSIVGDAMDAWGRVDILINNAGILRDKSFGKMTMDDFRLVLEVHLLGAVYVTHAAWPIMREQNYGRIVMTTSPSGLYGNFGQTNYGAAKLAQVGFMNALKIEGAKNNIHTNAIAPVAATRMTEDLMPEEALKALGPELVTPAVVYLCTEDAPNGVILQAAGGQFSIACMVENEGVNIGVDASVEDIADNYEKIADLSGAKPRGMLQLG